MDAQSNANSGALEVSLPFGTNGDQAVWFGTFHNGGGYDGTTIYDGTKFTNITFDVHVDPSSPLSPSGDFGVLQVGWFAKARPTAAPLTRTAQQSPPAPQTAGCSLNQTIDQTGSGLDTVEGVNFKYTSYSGYPTNPITFWIDNLDVHLATAKTPPPTLSPTLTRSTRRAEPLFQWQQWGPVSAYQSQAAKHRRKHLGRCYNSGHLFVDHHQLSGRHPLSRLPGPDLSYHRSHGQQHRPGLRRSKSHLSRYP